MHKALCLSGFLALGALAGCANQEQRDTANAGTCQRWGSPAGSEAFVQCMVLLRQSDAQSDAARSQALMAAGMAMQGASRAAQGPSSVHCTSVRTGTITNTDCQ